MRKFVIIAFVALALIIGFTNNTIVKAEEEDIPYVRTIDK